MELKVRRNGFSYMQFRYTPLVVLAFIAMLPGVSGQSLLLQQLNPLDSKAQGIHLYGVSVSYGYFSSAYNLGTAFPLINQGIAPVSTVQGSASFGWSKTGKDSSFSIVYAPSYVRGFTNSGYHSFNQNLAASGSWKFGSKWSLGATVQGVEADFNQLLFAPLLYGGTLGLSGTLQNILNPVSSVVTDTPVLPSVITGVPVAGSPQNAFLYGGREFSVSSGISLAYAQSTRSTYTVSLQANRTQFVKSGSSESMNIEPNSLLPQTTAVSGSIAWSYSLNPRTTVGLNLFSTRIVSKFEDVYSTSMMASISRMLTPHWFVQGAAGTGFINPVRGISDNALGLQRTYSATIGYRNNSHTLSGSYARTIADSYGIGALGTDSTIAAWTWRRPGSSISAAGSFGYSRSVGSPFSNFNTWIGQASASKVIDRHFVTSIVYSYACYPAPLLLQAPNASQSDVLLALGWSPPAR